jgi:UTP--glucose-1-phosphate uridylyltransferase
MLPATKALPKEMLPVATKPLIQYAIEELAASGITDIVLVVRDYDSLIQSHFACDSELESFLTQRGLKAALDGLESLKSAVSFEYVQQKHPLGLAHAISCARPLLEEEPFAVLLPDVIMMHEEPVTLQLIRAYEQNEYPIVAIREVPPEDVRRHGIVRIEAQSQDTTSSTTRLTGLVEKPEVEKAPSRLGIFGRYILNRSIWDAIGRSEPDGRGEIQLTDALNLLCQTELVYGLRFNGTHHDAGDPLGYIRANLDLSLRDTVLRQPLLNYLAYLQSVN